MAGKEIATQDPREIAILQSVAELLDRIPDAGGDGFGIIENILNANSVEDLLGEDSSKADDLDDMLGAQIRIDDLHKWESDFQGQPGQISDKYLICHGYNLASNTDVVFAVGGATPIAKLAKLWSFGVFPIVAVFKRSEKPTAQGFYPMNMSVVNVSQPVNA